MRTAGLTPPRMPTWPTPDTSERRWPINREVGDLADALPGCEPLWTFVRYDAPLEAKWLETNLGKTYTPLEIAALARLDDDRQVPRLYEIGEGAGDLMIRPEHFRDVFDPQTPSSRR